MKTTTDERAEAAVLERLGEGSADVLGLVDALTSRLGSAFSRVEGGVHPTVHGLVRQGRVEVDGRAVGGGALYRLATPGSDRRPPRPWDEELPAPEPPPPASRRASKTAVRIASGVADPEDRGRVVADVLAHLDALARAQASGAERAFGPATPVREALRRADRGRSRVAVALTSGERGRRFVVHELPGFLIAAAIFAATWMFLLEPRRIPSRSMEPTLLISDRMLVWKPAASGVPDRWSVVTFKNSTGDTLVKRLVGLPGERVLIRDGDLWIDDALQRKPEGLRRALKQRVAAASFSAGVPRGWERTTDPVTRRAYVRRVGPIAIDEGSSEHLHDVYLDAELSDASADADLFVGYGTAVLTLSRREGRVTLTLEDERGPQVVVPPTAAPAATGLSLAVVDGWVEASSDDWSFEGPVTLPRGEAAIGVAGAVASLVVSRDVHYTAQGEHGVDDGFSIPHDHLFVLGDRSHDSRDSRFRTLGPVPLARLSGKAVCRIWPPWRVGPIR